MNIKIEIPKEEDFVLMAEIYNKAIKPFWDVYSEEEKQVFKDFMIETAESLKETFLARNTICAKDENGKVFGYAMFRKKNETVVWLGSLYVDPDIQGKGIGKNLLKAVEDFALENKCKVVMLETHRNAIWAINFYKKNGYEIINDRIDEYPFNQALENPPVPNRPILAKVII